MYFGLTDEQKLLQQTIRELAAGELAPNQLRELFEQGTGFDALLWQKAAEVGLAGLMIPEQYGGVGLEMLDLALAFEVIGEAAIPGPFLSHSLAALAIARAGSEDQKERWLPQLATGDAIGSVALGEPEGMWTPQRWRSKLSDGSVSGAKAFVEYAAGASVIVIGTEGGGLAIVEGGARGIELEAVDGIDRTRSLAHMVLDATPAEALSGDPDAAEVVCDAARILLAADAFGGAWRLIRMTAEYALQREQYDTPIAQFQSVKHQLADLAKECEPVRGIVWYAAYAFDHLPAERAVEACNVKAHATDVAVDTARACVELHGGIGFTWECDVHFWLKRAMFDRTWLGTPREERERLVALKGW